MGREGWRDPGKSNITHNSQSRPLTALRAETPVWKDQNWHLAMRILWRVELAFQAFFRRMHAGEKPGYPRLKGATRFRTLEVRGILPSAITVRPGRGLALVSVKGLPTLELRLKNRTLPPAAQLKTLTITRKGNRCQVSLGFAEEKEPLPTSGKAVGLDMRLGIARVVTSDGTAWPARESDTSETKRLLPQIARAKRGSTNRAKLVRRLNNCVDRERTRDYNEAHRFTSQIVRDYDFIAIEDLDIKEMTRSAKGTVEAPGQNVALTADLNRRTLAQTWGEIKRQLTYKLEWAGRKIVFVDPNSTSRTRSNWGHLRPMPQVAPTFRCSRCGVRGAAAHNASINILRLRLQGLGEGGNKGLPPALDTPQDLVSIRALAWMRVRISPMSVSIAPLFGLCQ